MLILFFLLSTLSILTVRTPYLCALHFFYSTAQSFLSEYASLVSGASSNNDQVARLFAAARDAAHAQLQTVSSGEMGSEEIDSMWGGVLSRLIDDILTNG